MRLLLLALLGLSGCRTDATETPPVTRSAVSAPSAAPSSSAPALSRIPPRRYRAGDAEIEVRLVPEQTRVLLGEPLVVTFEIANLSDRELSFEQGGHADWQLGTDYLYDLSAIGPDGKALAVKPPRMNFSGLRGPLPIGARARFQKQLVVQNWVRFARPGRHRLRIDKQLKPLDATAIASVAETDVDVVPATPQGIGKVIDRLGAQLLARDEARAHVAAKALSYVDDARAITAFDRALDAPSISLRLAAVEGVATLSSPQALAVLARALKSSELEVRRAAARALERRKEPEASAQLAALYRDPDVEIRLVVVRALAKRRDDTATKLLRALAHDKSYRVNREAQSVLAGR